MKKGIAILMVTILVIDLPSCTSYKQLSTQEDFETYQAMSQIQVLEVHSKKDSIIAFNEKFPGKMADRQVFGLRQMQFPFSTSDSIVFGANDQKAAYVLSNGILYKIVTQDKSGFICISPDTTRTPFSDVTFMKIQKKDPVKSALLVVGLSAALIVVISVLIQSIDYSGIQI